MERIQKYTGPAMALAVFGVVAGVMWVGLTANAQEPTTFNRSFCAERESHYRDGILLYQCEVVDSGNGEFVVRESGATIGATPVDRPATPAEIAVYNAVLVERACLAERSTARIALETPISRVDVDALAIRIAQIESAIKECIK